MGLVRLEYERRGVQWHKCGPCVQNERGMKGTPRLTLKVTGISSIRVMISTERAVLQAEMSKLAFLYVEDG